MATRLEAVLDHRVELSREIAPAEDRQIHADLVDRQVHERDRRVCAGTVGMLRDPRVETDRTLADARLDLEAPGRLVGWIDAQRQLTRRQIPHRDFEAMGLGADGVIAERDHAVAESDGVGGERPVERFAGLGLRLVHRVTGHGPRQEQAFLQPVESNGEAVELELLDLDRLGDESQPADLGPDPLRLEERLGIRRQLVDVDFEPVERDTTADQRQIEVGEGDPADERRVGLRDDHRAKHVRQRDTHDHEQSDDADQNPRSRSSQGSRETFSVGELHTM